ncbi:molybdopterin-guanine dinucleotide biosynthesis protein A [Methylobacterium sp. 4-46]|uniref:DUF3305 domain-containing protein n=1 Tax=unclassified Methylobacterium TaxID=2615210 RepID=UPI000152CFBB|nr:MULTISPECIES: DUF3305 domain-containing protein [Methylobacterium]ACA17493.1 molybdopterin-guanine dinucleotide biosynthesis protein A [Methylobacterium sp. 4-46]WFT83177.1 DUF3305 domain-containing protein [Methylobacterium nodulans]
MSEADPRRAGVAPRYEVGVIVAKRRLKGPWASHAWLPVAALPGRPETPPWTRLGASEAEETFYAGSVTVALHPAETAHYGDNLASAQPSLWIALRPVGPETYEIATVTADPYEGEALAEGIGEIVEAVPMPPEMQAWLAAYYAAHHVERPFEKRKRDRADPEALARQGRRRDDER